MLLANKLENSRVTEQASKRRFMAFVCACHLSGCRRLWPAYAAHARRCWRMLRVSRSAKARPLPDFLLSDIRDHAIPVRANSWWLERPVSDVARCFLIALLGFAIDSFIMAWAPSLTWLFVGADHSLRSYAVRPTPTCQCLYRRHFRSLMSAQSCLRLWPARRLVLGFIFGPASGRPARRILDPACHSSSAGATNLPACSCMDFSHVSRNAADQDEPASIFHLARANPTRQLDSRLGRVPSCLASCSQPLFCDAARPIIPIPASGHFTPWPSPDWSLVTDRACRSAFTD